MVLLLDGGLSTELEKDPWNKKLDSSLWSAAVLADDPQSIASVHLSYMNAGCDIISTCSYQASISGFLSAGFDEESAINLLQSSVNLAVSAISEYTQLNPTSRKKLAISIGCYGAYLANGSEYTGDYGDISHQQLFQFHKTKLETLLKAESLSTFEKQDLYIAFETIPSELEALAIADLCKLPMLEYLKIWVSFCCKDGLHLTDGSKLIDAVKNIPQTVIVGVNCCKPEYVESLLSELGSRPKIAYGNSGQDYSGGKWHGNARSYVDFAKQWLNDPNLEIVGGCCKTTPKDMLDIKKYIQSSS